MRFRRLCNLSVNVFVLLTLLGNEEKIEKKCTGFNGPINSRYTPQVCFDYCPPPLIAKFNTGGEDGGRDPFNQNSNRSDREKWSTSKCGPVFSKLFRLDRTDPLGFGPKFPEILDEWNAPGFSQPYDVGF